MPGLEVDVLLGSTGFNTVQRAYGHQTACGMKPAMLYQLGNPSTVTTVQMHVACKIANCISNCLGLRRLEKGGERK